MVYTSRTANRGTHTEGRPMKLLVNNQRVDDNVISYLFGSTSSCASYTNTQNSVSSKLTLVTSPVHLAHQSVNVREIFPNIKLTGYNSRPKNLIDDLHRLQNSITLVDGLVTVKQLESFVSSL